MFALAFDRRWQAKGVRAFTVAPGIIKDTNLHHHLSEEHFSVLRARQETAKLPRKSLGEGAATPVFALVHPALDGEGGLFLEDCAVARVNADPTQAEGVIPWVLDEKHAEEVWALSQRLVGESFGAGEGGAVSSGLAGNRLACTHALEERTFEFDLDDGGVTRIELLAQGRARWANLPGFALAGEGTARCEVIEAAPGVYFIDLLPAGSERETVTIAWDSASHRALVVATSMGERTERPAGRVRHGLTTRFRQRFSPARRRGAKVSGAAPAPTRELIGTRALYVYGPQTVYEHVYLSSDWYAYNCILGARRGDAGCDEATVYKLADGVLVLGWREVLIDMAAIFVYDLKAMRTTGKAWGTPGGETRVRNIPAGARIHPLGVTRYPEGMAPV